MLVDAVICTKDRPEKLESALSLIEAYIPYNRILVVDSSEKPFKPKNGNITVYHTPNVPLGVARNFSLKKVETELMFGMDDDIQITGETFGALMQRLMESEDIAVVSPIMPYGNMRSQKIVFAARKRCGGTGVFLARTKLLRKVGGFAEIKYGEDLACYYRLQDVGLRWESADTVCFHPGTLLGNLKKSWRNGYYMIDIYRDNPQKHNLFSILLKSVGRLFMSVYYGVRTKDFFCFKWYLLSRFCYVLAWFGRMLT